VTRLGWTLREVALATGGELVGDDAIVDGVGIDSRAVAGGELFVAVPGERFDGHDYVRAAARAGAAGVLVAQGRGDDIVPRVEVVDTVTALRDLAVKRRNEISVPVIAITGSTGKTSTKDLAAAALDGGWASPRSFNNEVGVPLTLLATPADARYLIVEVGSRGKGHITWLAPAVRPDVAIITNLGVVHLETFGTREVLADAKWELVESLAESGIAVVPVDDPRLHRPHPGHTRTFGMSAAADVAIARLELDDWGRPRFDLVTEAGTRSVALPLPGRHQATNAAAATAAALAVGADLDAVVTGLEHATAAQWRMEIHRGSFTVVNDAYNANPDSMEAALRTTAALPGRHVAVLGLMAELGSVEETEHVRIGELAAELGFAAVVVVGRDPGIARGAGRIARSVDDADDATRVVRGFLRPGDAVLVKASRVVGLEKVALALVEEAAE
jgi:UDP-N-acetylmuramoyl-tripeptide--D-alanyl-D-alanine ligase